MPLTTEDVARMTTPGADDEAFARERRSRRKRTAPPVAPADGPCCARCRSWTDPEDGESFGSCRELVLARGRRSGDERVMDKGEAHKRMVEVFEPLRTAAGFACRGFAAPGGERAA